MKTKSNDRFPRSDTYTLVHCVPLINFIIALSTCHNVYGTVNKHSAINALFPMV